MMRLADWKFSSTSLHRLPGSGGGPARARVANLPERQDTEGHKQMW